MRDQLLQTNPTFAKLAQDIKAGRAQIQKGIQQLETDPDFQNYEKNLKAAFQAQQAQGAQQPQQ